MSIKPPPIRPRRVILAVASGLLVFLFLTALYHPFRVWLAGGEWCMRAMPDGGTVTLYEKECG